MGTVAEGLTVIVKAVTSTTSGSVNLVQPVVDEEQSPVLAVLILIDFSVDSLICR